MKFENFLKGFFTTIIGFAMMALAVYEWWIGEEENVWHLALPMVCGFALLYMRDKVSEFIGELGKRFLNKFFPPKENGQ